MVLRVSIVGLVLLSCIAYSTVKEICIILNWSVGRLESRCWTTIVFVKDVQCFSGVTRYPDFATVLHCRLLSTSKHLECWRNIVDKAKVWPSWTLNIKTVPTWNKYTSVLWDYDEKWYFSAIINFHLFLSFNLKSVQYHTISFKYTCSATWTCIL